MRRTGCKDLIVMKWENVSLRTGLHLVLLLSIRDSQLDLILVVPGNDVNKVGHKRWNGALENRRIATDHVLIVHLALIELLNNCCDTEIPCQSINLHFFRGE